MKLPLIDDNIEKFFFFFGSSPLEALFIFLLLRVFHSFNVLLKWKETRVSLNNLKMTLLPVKIL